MPDFKVLTAGDTALVVEFGDSVDRKISTFVLGLARRLDEIRLNGVVETVPTFRSLMVYYDPLVIPATALISRIKHEAAALRVGTFSGREWRLPVCYDPALAPDLIDVAARADLSPAQVIERHAAATYHVYMLGFLPGLAYMGDVVPELVLPRRVTPRQRVAAGSVAIATTMSIIFPRESPTGWHVIGRSPVEMWRRPSAGAASAGVSPQAGALLAPGDKVTHAPISLAEFENLAARAAAGALDVAPINTAAEAAA